jgi:Capsule assembly protein Wzi
MKLASAGAGWLLVSWLLAPAAVADPWIAPGDARLRHDLELLADAGLIQVPLTAWPVSWPEVARDIDGIPPEAGRPEWLLAAIERVRDGARKARGAGYVEFDARLSGSEMPMELRRFGATPREEGELSAGAEYTGERFAYRLQATGAADPDDGKSARPDGSYAAVTLGNWMVHAGYIDRWWGPGWEGSLIYGSNARPIPSVTIERNFSDAVDHPWLEWAGQWRIAATMGQLEASRDDAPNAQFFGARLTWKPHRRIEIGLSRSAQWCGDGRPCDAETFWDLLTGNDNDQAAAEQPGNQMAGFDARWSVPWAPIAVYGQMIGEDEAGMLPSQYLGLFGVEAFGGFGDRSWRVHLEYADTACSFYDSEPNFGCAYRNFIYFDGYQYRDRSIGHSIDGDSEQVAAGLLLVNGDGSGWELAVQSAKLNRGSANPVHSVEPAAADSLSADLYYRRPLWDGDLAIAVGYEERERDAPAEDTSDLRGFLQLTWEFD